MGDCEWVMRFVCVRGWGSGRVVEWVSWCVDDDDNALYDPAYRHRILWWRGAIPHGSPHTHTALPTRPRPSSPLISPPSPSCGGCSAMLCVSVWVHGPDHCGIQGPCIVHYEAPRGRREYRGCGQGSWDEGRRRVLGSPWAVGLSGWVGGWLIVMAGARRCMYARE